MDHSRFYWAYLAAFGVSAFSTVLFTPLTIRIAERFKVMDKPGPRKIHLKSIPRMGGLAIFAGIAFTFLMLSIFSAPLRDLILQHSKPLFFLALGAIVLFLMGLVDDARGLTPRTKLRVQVVAGMLAFYGGFQFNLIPIGPLAGGWLAILASLMLTIFWTVGTTNAVNLIDGLDGLASGITAIALSVLGFISIRNGHLATALAAFIAAGAAFGFLWHNRHPAKIFLGDSGSMLLGFLLATLSIEGAKQGSLVASLLVPICLLYLPILDTTLAIVRRAQKGLPFNFADNHHIHHRLLRQGIHHPHVVLILWGVTLSVGGLALVLQFVENSYRMLAVNVFAVLLLGLTVRYLGHLEVKQYLHSLRNINRRKQTAREKITSLRRGLVALDACETADALLRAVSGIAKRLELDSIAIFMAPDGREEERINVYRWTSNLQDLPGGGDWVATPKNLVHVDATSVYEVQPGSTITVELGRQSWKARRLSEDAQLWANLFVRKLAVNKALCIFCPGESFQNMNILEMI